MFDEFIKGACLSFQQGARHRDFALFVQVTILCDSSGDGHLLAGVENGFDPRRIHQGIADQAGVHGAENSHFVVGRQAGCVDVYTERSESGGACGLLGSHLDFQPFLGQRTRLQILGGIKTGASSQRNQQKLGRGHALICSTIIRWLVADHLMAARAGGKLHSSQVLNGNFHKVSLRKMQFAGKGDICDYDSDMTSRRDFLAALTAAGLQAKPLYRPKLTLQPYVWTQQFQKDKVTLSMGMEQLFPASKRAGYKRIELMDSFLTTELREKTAGLVRQYGFEVPVVYHGGTFHDADAAEETIRAILATADAAKLLGAEWINTNCNPKKGRERKTDQELAVEARSLNRLGQALKDRGMRLMLHQHDPDMAEGARGWRSNLRNTDPGLMWFCVDVHWVYRGKQDPMELLKEAGTRIANLHVRNSVNGVWSESLGDGDVDYRAVTKFLESIGYQGFIAAELAYEKDTKPTRPLEEDLRISREYAEKVFKVGR